MRKEQTLVVVCVALAGLVVWSSTGQYESAGVKGPWTGKDMDIRPTVPYDVLYGLLEKAPGDRPFNKEMRADTRPELPAIAPPGPLSPQWVRPVPWPGPESSFWNPLRERITVTERPKPESTAEEPEDPDQDPVDPTDVLDDFGKSKKKFSPDDAAVLMWSDGRKDICRLVPQGAFKGQPVWVILAQWGKVPFLVQFLNGDGSVRAELPIDDPAAQNVTTVHLSKTLENEFNEQRIRRSVRDDDRAAQIDLARWTVETLAPKYSVAAIKLALKNYEQAYTLSADLALVREMGEVYRKAYDLDGELALYQRFLKAKSESPQAMALVAEAMTRSGAYGPAGNLFDQAAVSGDPEIVLAYAECLLRAKENAKAAAQFNKVRGNGGGLLRGRALVGLAVVALRQGQFKDALTLATDATKADPSSPEAHNAYGCAQYCTGQYAAAEKSFGTADALWGGKDTRARSNQAFAMIATGKLQEALDKLQSCLDEDPLNYFLPLVGIAEVHQRWGELTEANDALDTALLRKPHDPWILLRRATARLRDGAGAQALELGGKALEEAPSSVDALRVLGLASGATGDHAAAVRYLRRAVSKEPENLELIYELCREYLLNGQVDAAAKLLAKVTDVNTGFGNRDSRLLALTAYAMFQAKQDPVEVLEMISKAKISRPDAETQAWLDRTQDIIVEWSKTRIWQDEFDQQPGAVQNGWTVDAARGPRAQLQGTTVAISGAVRSEGGEERNATRLFRAEEMKGFVRAEASFRLGQNDEVVFHFGKGDLPPRVVEGDKPGRPKGAEFGLGILRGGEMAIFATLQRDRKKPQEEILLLDADGNPRKWPQDGQFHTVEIVRTDARKGVFQLFFDGEQITVPDLQEFEVGTLSRTNGNGYVGFLVDGDVGHTVNVEVEYVRITRTLGN